MKINGNWFLHTLGLNSSMLLDYCPNLHPLGPTSLQELSPILRESLGPSNYSFCRVRNHLGATSHCRRGCLSPAKGRASQSSKPWFQIGRRQPLAKLLHFFFFFPGHSLPQGSSFSLWKQVLHLLFEASFSIAGFFQTWADKLWNQFSE